MLYLPNSKTMVLHIPKCGGVWVASAIQATTIKWYPYRLQHDDLSCADHPDAENIVVFVRHPVEWYRSYWRYRMQQDLIGAWLLFDCGHPTERLDACGSSNFETFVENCLAKFPGYVTTMFGMFTNNWDVNIGQQEYLRADLCTQLSRVDEKFDEEIIMNHPRQNTSKGPEVKWPDKLWQRVADAEQVALERYGYTC